METLPELVEDIKAKLEIIKSEYGTMNDRRLEVAKKITKARDLVRKGDAAAEGMTWEKFATEHFGLSWSEIKKLVKIGLSDDLEKAMADVREKTRKSAAKSRKPKDQKGSYVGALEKAGTDGGGDSRKSNGEKGGPEPGTVEQELDRIICAYKAASDDARRSFRQWLARKDGIDALPRHPSVKPGAMRSPPAQAIPATA